MKIIYEDTQLLVCHKPAGLATQTSRLGEKDAVSELKNYLKGSYLGLVHRLDQPVEGLLVFAKTQEAAKELSRQLAEHIMNKIYIALIWGCPEKKMDRFVDFLIKDQKTNSSKVSQKDCKDAKIAELSYQVLSCTEQQSLVRIELATGRHHQIRVQMSHAGHPLMGDLKYGTGQSIQRSREQDISQPALCASELAFLHPVTKEKMCFQTEPEGTWRNAI